jgi:hypothetical protein
MATRACVHAQVRGENLQAYIAERFPALASRIRFLKVDAEGYDYQYWHRSDLIGAQKPFIKGEVFAVTPRAA